MAVSLYFFFLILFLFSFPKRQQNEGLSRNSNGRTEGTDPGACIGQKRLSCQIDESCTTLVGTSMPPQKKKKAEGGAKFKCNYSGHGKSPREVFNDKYLELLKQNGWGWREKVAEHLGGLRGGLQRPHADHG